MIDSCISVAVINNTIALANLKRIDIFDIISGQKKISITSVEDIVKVISCDDQFAFISLQSVGIIFESTNSKYVVQPHLQQNIKDKAKDIEFKYVDLIYDKCLYIVNYDGKTILLDNKLTTLRWQNIEELKFIAQNIFNVDGKSIILFDNGVLKINKQDNLQFLGKVAFSKIKNCQYLSNYSILKGIGVFGDIILVLSNGTIVSIAVEIVQGSNGKERVGTVQKIYELGGGLNQSAQSSLYHQFVAKSSNKLMIIRDLDNQKDMALDLLPQFIKHIFLNDDVILGIHKSYNVKDYQVPNIQNSQLVLSFINRLKAGPVKFYGLQSINQTDFIDVFELDDYLSIMFANKSGNISSFILNMTQDLQEVITHDLKAELLNIKQIDINNFAYITKNNKVVILNIQSKESTLFVNLDKFAKIFSLTVDKEKRLIIIGVIQEFMDNNIMIYQPKIFIYQKGSPTLISAILLTETSNIQDLPIEHDILLLNMNNQAEQLCFAIIYKNQLQIRLLCSGIILDIIDINQINVTDQVYMSFYQNKLNLISNQFYLQYSGITLDTIQSYIDEGLNYEQAQQKTQLFNEFDDTQFNTQINNSYSKAVSSANTTKSPTLAINIQNESAPTVSEIQDEQLRNGLTEQKISIVKKSIAEMSSDFDEDIEKVVQDTIKTRNNVDDLDVSQLSNKQSESLTQNLQRVIQNIQVINENDYFPIFNLRPDQDLEIDVEIDKAQNEQIVGSSTLLKTPITPVYRDSISNDFDDTVKEITASQLVKLENSQTTISTIPIELNNQSLTMSISLTSTLVQMQQVLNQQILLAETQDINLQSIPANQRKEVKKQVDLLQNTIRRINLLYDFDDDVEKKLEELTKTLLGMTIKSDK
ncbi:hypothetical protein SS50377_25587 [Spironucleus salmonicida]|uniref:Uncharacterized protein n=1 Tax=Spironucleus salmonicida TaxID=348837 RepID=V6LWE5_9EUKA|nr:hypothetical protein SS50377_25587 [Spironucleus salmonicida]|eukprot:EST45134.1 Hypothetical protein SS50377_15156 [Spironucleus salmonicida]